MDGISSSRPFFQRMDPSPEEKVQIDNECGWFSSCNMSFSDNSTRQYSDSSVNISNSGNTTTTNQTDNRYSGNTTTQTDSRSTDYQLYSGNSDNSSNDFRPYSGNHVDYRPNSGNPTTTNTDNSDRSSRTSNQPVLIPVIPAWVRNLPAAQNPNGSAAIWWSNPVSTQSPNAEIGNGTATNNGGDAALPIIEEDLFPVQTSPSTATGSTAAGQSPFSQEDGRVR